MGERASYLIVGVFVLVAALTTAVFTVWIAGGRGGTTMTTYTVLFDRDISGLAAGSPVRYLGVDIGDVVAMRLVTDSATRVAVEIEIAADTPIHQGTYASLAYLGITGVAFINLAADAGQFEPLAATPTGASRTIPVREVGLAALFAQSGDITAEVNRLLAQANELLSDDNQEYLTQTLANVELMTDTLVGERETLSALPQRLVAALDDTQAMMGQLSELLDRAEPDLLAATSQLNEATAGLAQLTSRLDDWFRSNEESIDTFVAEGLSEIPDLLASTERTLRELDKLLTDVREDPSQLIYRPQRRAIQVEP